MFGSVVAKSEGGVSAFIFDQQFALDWNDTICFLDTTISAYKSKKMKIKVKEIEGEIGVPKSKTLAVTQINQT